MYTVERFQNKSPKEIVITIGNTWSLIDGNMEKPTRMQIF